MRVFRCRRFVDKESDAFSMVVVQHFDGVAIKDGDDKADKLSCFPRRCKENNEQYQPTNMPVCSG